MGTGHKDTQIELATTLGGADLCMLQRERNDIVDEFGRNRPLARFDLAERPLYLLRLRRLLPAHAGRVKKNGEVPQPRGVGAVCQCHASSPAPESFGERASVHFRAHFWVISIWIDVESIAYRSCHIDHAPI